MKSLVRNINIGNIVLTVMVAFFLSYQVSPFFILQIAPSLPSAKKQKQETAEEEQETEIPSPAEFMSVSEQNLFHPERKIPVEKKAEQPLPKPDFVLYGTMITDGLRLAYVEDLKAPRSSPGRGKRQITLKKGERISGFTLKEIHTDKIVLVRGEEQLTVPINDPDHLKDRSAPEAQQTSSAPPLATISKTPPLKKADQKPPQSTLQGSPPFPGTEPEKPGRRRGSQKTFAPHIPKQ